MNDEERMVEHVLLGVSETASDPVGDRCWGIVTKHASFGPRLTRDYPERAPAVRAELLRYVLDAPAKAAIETLEAFDFEYPRGWAIVIDEDDPYAGGVTRDHEAQQAPTRAAWELCRAAIGAHPDELERLRGGVREILAGWPVDVVAWYVAQADAVAEASGTPP